jgi:hypothetical protein
VKHLLYLAGWVILAMAAVRPLPADLGPIKAEPNLEKRSKLALDNAVAVLKQAREAYSAGDQNQTQTALAEFQESVEMAYDALLETHKDPRKSPKWFKRAEIATRDLERSLESFEHDMSYTDRPMLVKVRERVQTIHDNLLTGLMEGKRK